MENATNRRMNAIKHHHPAEFKDAFGGAKLGKVTMQSHVIAIIHVDTLVSCNCTVAICFPGNVNGVNVIGLALQGPSVPSIAVLHHNGPYNLQNPTGNPPLSLHPIAQLLPNIKCRLVAKRQHHIHQTNVPLFFAT